MKRPRHRNGGLRKVCRCPRRQWPKCEHAWHFNFKPRRGRSYRLSLDVVALARGERPPRGKTEAERWRDALRTEMRAGTFADPSAPPPVPTPTPATPDAVTFRSFGETFLARRGKPATASDQSHMRRLMAFDLPGAGAIGNKQLGAITEDDVELFFAHLREQGRAASTRNKFVSLVKAMFRWAVRKKYLQQNPIADSESIKRDKHARRHRRLEPDVIDPATGKVQREGEERRLLAVAASHLQRLIIAALETGCRRGELLALEWRNVDLQRRWLTVRAATTKTRTARVLPVSDRLAGVLEMAKAALSASLFADRQLSEQERAAMLARCHVFGDDAGLRVKDFKKAWATAVLKAHGVAPVWCQTRLAPPCLAALRQIDLHFHDLRHEAGSRFIEDGWPIHHVSEMLGHTNLEQTSTYLNVTRAGLQESMRRRDQAVAHCKVVANETGIEHGPLRNDGLPQPAESLIQ